MDYVVYVVSLSPQNKFNLQQMLFKKLQFLSLGLLLGCWMIPVSVKAQDPQFSQFYAAPLYLNPAFAGSTQQGRVGMNYRNQWPSIDANFTTISAYADFYLEDYNSGLGAIFTRDYANVLGLQNTGFGIQYAYQLKITKNISLRPGVQVSVNSRSIDYTRLIFGDQIDPATGSISSGTIEQLRNGPKVFFGDLAFGGLLFSKRALPYH
jgi:type IX secretion system PorP/SprF family membrane protein